MMELFPEKLVLMTSGNLENLFVNRLELLGLEWASLLAAKARKNLFLACAVVDLVPALGLETSHRLGKLNPLFEKHHNAIIETINFLPKLLQLLHGTNFLLLIERGYSLRWSPLPFVRTVGPGLIERTEVESFLTPPPRAAR